MTLSITMLCHYAQCQNLFIIMLCVIMLSVIMLNVVMLSVIILSVVAHNMCLKASIYLGPDRLSGAPI